MQGSFGRRRWWIAAGAAVLVLAGVGALLPVALDAGYFRPALIRFLESRFNRQIRIEGRLQLQLWSHSPRVVAEQVTIGNPPWAPPGEMARIGRVTLLYSAPGFGHSAELESVTLEDANLHLERDAAGRANWQRVDPTTTHGKGIPLIRELSAADVHVLLDDQRRHLQFDGIVSAQGLRHGPAPRRLHIAGKGQLNGRPATFDLSADPLETARREVPYAWEFSEESSGSRAKVHGFLPRPFDFDLMNASFEADGEDLKDLYFLTGVTLVNTGAYRLTGSVERRAASTRFTQLKLSSGQSDLRGSLSIETVNGRPQFDAALSANLLRTADFGARAAGRGPPPDAPPRIFSDAVLFNPDALRRADTRLRFNAQRVDVGRMSLQSVSGQMKIDHGVVTVTPLTADFLQGRLEARIRLDANKDMPAAEASMRFADLQLSALNHKDPQAPVEGLMQARIDITGQGRSVHQVAATANGTVNAEVPHGMIRSSLAELAGVDLRGLGLTLTRSKREAAVRCAAASFRANDGTLTARSIVVDTEPVVIRGAGSIRLDTEQLDLTLRGEPKDLRLLRVDAPLLVGGTLARPSIAIQTHAGSVKLLDRGAGKDVDCASLLAASRAEH
jgi:AsmA family protein